MSRRNDRGREPDKRNTNDRHDRGRDRSYESSRAEKRRHEEYQPRETKERGHDSFNHRERSSGVRVNDERHHTDDSHDYQYETANIDYENRNFVGNTRGRGRGRGNRGRGRGTYRGRGGRYTNQGPAPKAVKYTPAHDERDGDLLDNKFRQMESKLVKSNEAFQDRMENMVSQMVAKTTNQPDASQDRSVEPAQDSAPPASIAQTDTQPKKKKRRDDPTWGKLQIRIADGKPLMLPSKDVPIGKLDQKLEQNWSKEREFGVNGTWVNPLDRNGKMKCHWIMPDGFQIVDYDTPALKDMLCKLEINRAHKDAVFINFIKYIDNLDGASPARIWFNDTNPDALQNIAASTRITCVHFKHALQGLSGSFFLKGHCKEAKGIQHSYYASDYAVVAFTGPTEITWIVPSPADLLTQLTDILTNCAVEISGTTAALKQQSEVTPIGTFGLWEKNRVLPFIYNQTQPAINLSCLGVNAQYQKPSKWQQERFDALVDPKAMFLFGMGGRPLAHGKKELHGMVSHGEINRCLDPKIFQLCLGIKKYSMPSVHVQWTIRNIFYQSATLMESRSVDIRDYSTNQTILQLLKGPWTKTEFFSGHVAAQEGPNPSLDKSEQTGPQQRPDLDAGPSTSSNMVIPDAMRAQMEKDLQANFLTLVNGQQLVDKKALDHVEKYFRDVIGLSARQIPENSIFTVLKRLETDIKSLNRKHENAVNELKFVYSIFHKQISVLQISTAMINCMRTVQFCHPSQFETDRANFATAWDKMASYQKLMQCIQDLTPALVAAERDLVRISRGYRIELPTMATAPALQSLEAHKPTTGEYMETFAIGCQDANTKKQLMDFKKASTFNVRAPPKGKNKPVSSIVPFTQKTQMANTKQARKKTKKVDASQEQESGIASQLASQAEEELLDDTNTGNGDEDGIRDDGDEDNLLNESATMGEGSDSDEDLINDPPSHDQVNCPSEYESIFNDPLDLSDMEDCQGSSIDYNHEFQERDFFIPIVPREDRLIRTKNPRFTRAIGGTIDAYNRHIIKTDFEIEQIRYKHKLIYPQDEFDRNSIFLFVTLFGVDFLQLLDDIIAFVPASQDWTFNLIKKDASHLIQWYKNNHENFQVNWDLITDPESKFHLTKEENAFPWPRMGEKTLTLLLELFPKCIPGFPMNISNYGLKFLAVKLRKPDTLPLIKEKIKRHRKFFHIDNDPYLGKRKHNKCRTASRSTPRSKSNKNSCTIETAAKSEFFAKPERIFIKMKYTLYENDLRAAFQILMNNGSDTVIPNMARISSTKVPSTGLSIPFINFKYKKCAVLNGMYVPHILTVEDIELFQIISHNMPDFPDSSKLLVTKSEEDPRYSPKDIDVCPKGYFTNLKGQMPKFDPLFQKIFDHHKLQLAKSTWSKVKDTMQHLTAVNTEDHVLSDKIIDDIVLPTETFGKIKILSANLNLFQSQFFTLNKSAARADIYLLQELNLSMTGFNAIKGKLDREFHVFHHEPVWEKGDSLRMADFHVYSIILVRKTIDVTLKLIKDISPPATMVLVTISPDTSIFLTTIYATRPNQKMKNEALGMGVTNNSWLQFYTGVYRQIAAAQQGGIAIFTGDINMDIENFREFDSAALAKIFVSLFDQYENKVTKSTFARGQMQSQIDIFMLYNIQCKNYKTWDGRVMAHNDGHSLLCAEFDLDLAIKTNTKLIEIKHKPSDNLLNIAWLIVRLKNDTILEESYSKHAADISQAIRTGVFPEYAGKNAQFVTQLMAILEHTITACSPLYPAKVVNCTPIPFEDKDTKCLRKTLLDWRKQSDKVPKDQWNQIYRFGLSVLKRKRNDNQVTQLIRQVGKRLHINSWRLLKLELQTFKPSTQLPVNNITPTVLTKQFHELQRRGLLRKCTVTWPKYTGVKFSFDDWQYDYEGRKNQGASLRKCLLDSRSAAKGHNSNLSAPLLKHLPYGLHQDLARVTQIVTKLGCFPSADKNMRIVTIPKHISGPQTCLDLLKLLRCLSIQHTWDGVTQRRVSYRFQEFLLDNQLVTDVQHGFRVGRSCSTLYGELMVDLNEARLRKRKYAIILSYDVKNAFGSISHVALKERLSQICEKAPALYFQGVLDDRTSTMSLNGEQGSTLMAHPIGVPQGTPLAPILFILWMNGLEDICKDTEDTTIRLYADDCSISVVCDDLESGQVEAERASNALIQVLEKRGIELSSPKSRCVIIHLTGKPDLERELRVIRTVNGPIKETPSLTLLGIDINNKLDFGTRIMKLKSAMYQNSGKALNITNILSTDKALLWMKSTNVGVFSYGSEILPLYTDAQYESLDKAASLPALDILGLQHLKATYLTTRILNSIGNKPSFKDWHVKNILVFSSEIVRKRDPIKIADFIVKNLSFSNGDRYSPGKVIENYCKGYRIKFDKRASGPLFPCNLGTCLSLIPAEIANLFGTYSFVHKLKIYTNAKCPHGALVNDSGETCSGCTNRKIAITRIVLHQKTRRTIAHTKLTVSKANDILKQSYDSTTDMLNNLLGIMVEYEAFLDTLDFEEYLES